MIRTKLAAVITFLAVLQPLNIAAFETDQFNLSPQPLVDISSEVEAHVRSSLEASVASVNHQIAALETCGPAGKEKANNCGSRAEVSRKLAFLRSNGSVAHELYKRLGAGSLFTTKFDKWISKHKFVNGPWRYKTNFRESIYKANPFDLITISPTIKLYGSEFGIDKLSHLFQQGYQYYEIRQKELSKGSSESAARMKAVEWGKMTERTYFGLLVGGVYSNADLFANYAGLEFYVGLTGAGTDENRRPVIAFENERWGIVSTEPLLKPFLTDHMNEALNPSGYSFNMIRSVRRAVTKYACPDWRRVHPDLAAPKLENQMRSLETWNGEDYGHTPFERVVRISEVCYNA